MPQSQKEKNIALYEREYETFEDQLRDWYRARRAATMQKLLAGHYLGTDTLKRLMSESTAEEIQNLLQGKATLEELKVLESEKAEAARQVHEEQVQSMWANIITLPLQATSLLVPGSGPATQQAGKEGLALAGFGKDVTPFITAEQEAQAEINKRLEFLKNYLDVLKTEPELEIPEELNLSRFEGKKSPWWEYWQV